MTDAPQVLLLGGKAGADMAVSGFYWMENNRILVSLQCYDVKAGTLLTGFLHTWRFNLGFYNSIHAEIADLVERVVFLSAPRLITLKDEVRVDEITFASPQDGMEVVIEGQKSVGRIQDGTLVFQTHGIKAGTPLRVEKQQEGYHTLWQNILAAPEVLLTPLPRKNILSLELDWTAGQLQGAGATLRWYPVPDWIMVNFSEYLHTQVPLVPNGSLPIHADSELLAGLYLFLPPESGFRFGISAGVGTILTYIPSGNLPIFTDVYINLLSIWGEWRVWGIPMFCEDRAEGSPGRREQSPGAGKPHPLGRIPSAHHDRGRPSMEMKTAGAMRAARLVVAARLARAVRLAAVLLAVLSLGSCEVLTFIFSSVFPSTAVLMKAQANLSGQIPANNGSVFLRVVESGGFGYVVVVASLASTGTTAFFYDLDLNPKTTLTGLTGNGVMVDSAGFIVVGTQKLNAADLSSAGTLGVFTINSHSPCGVDGFLETSANPMVANIFISGGATLNYVSYGSNWSGSTTPTPLPTLSTTISNLNLNAVLDDGALTGNAILVTSQPGSGDTATCYFIVTSKNNFPSSTIPAGIMDSAPHRDGLLTETLGFAQGSIFAYDKGASSFVRIDPATAATQASFYSAEDTSSSRFAYRISGGFFYGFNTKTRVLTKYSAWWQ